MLVEFPVLDASRACQAGAVSYWHVSDGEQVARGRVLAEVQVGDVEAEVLAPASGTVHLVVAQDESTAQGAPIARIE
ncbi:MAG: biotin/lipoyl-containing protein [Georgenia sp.]